MFIIFYEDGMIESVDKLWIDPENQQEIVKIITNNGVVIYDKDTRIDEMR